MLTAKVPHVTEEEENYLRMHLLMTKISSRAVRVLFDKEFSPVCLDATIKKETGKLMDLKSKHIINGAQWKLLFPRVGVPDSNTFDVTLMVALLRNLTKLPPPTGGYDYLPLTTDTTPVDDLARIKHYRNSLAQFGDGEIKSTVFVTAWENISGAVKRLGGLDMAKECQELRSKHLDQSTVPWNIRVQIIQILDQWQKNDEYFVETKAAKHVLKCIQENSCVTITASSGVGKTATLQHVVLKMADEGYDVVLVTNPHTIIEFYNPNQKTLFVIDNFCGTYSINRSDLYNWESVMMRIEELVHKSLIKIIVACRIQVYKDKKFEALHIFKTNVCNLLSEYLCLSQAEKTLIAEMYLETEAAEIIQYSHLYDCFPLLCKLYRVNTEPSITAFFKNPFSVYEAEIEQLKKNEFYGKYCALALCVMFNNELKEEVLKEEIDKETKRIIKNTCEACRLERSTSRLMLLDELDTLEHTFLKKKDGVYRTIHDKLFDFLSYYFGKMIIPCLIKNSESMFISERFSFKREEDLEQFIIVVPTDYHQMYIQRMVDDWSSGWVMPVFNNKNMDKPDFRKRFLNFVETLDLSYQKQLAQTDDIIIKHGALLFCCFICDFSLIQWFCFHGADVNKCRPNGVSPLSVSSQEGDTEAVKLLLEYKADVYKCRADEISPLFLACQQNHIEIVKMLLEHKADVNKCNKNEVSPLFMACRQNHTEIVKMLHEYKADVNKCDKNEASPLLMSCRMDHVKIVKMLLEYKADVNKCEKNEVSPLYLACHYNHTEIVKMLLEYKADVNKCDQNEVSPLLIACLEDNVKIVKMLLEYKADVNKCDKNEVSPLLMACHQNHIEIVKILLKYKSDINKCDKNEVSPLLLACRQNNVKIVKILLECKAEVNKCDKNEVSPLFLACQHHHIEIVKILLEYKADVNICDKNEVSPLFMACHEIHIEIVKMLLEYKADVNICDKNEVSPLFFACQQNHIEIVKMLLEYKADVNKCDKNEVSPLQMACQQNHVAVVKILLEYKADVNKCTKHKASPLLIACGLSYSEIDEIRHEYEADVDKCDENKLSSLLMACMQDHAEIVKMLLEHKADVNKCSEDEASPLFRACQENHIEIVEILLKYKADVNKCNENELSPLFLACQENHIEIVKMLLEYKADVNKCDKNEVSPLQMACQQKHVDVVQILSEYKADEA
ncbi:uncharacterized protein LOC134687792 [Mytilus trossulus]|uniref:uncharacterized protein LOC134687792 n=1 Tax=Mytilus trossulus TaxID=6551 RepID=UPI0030042300